jgi:hypothetical protein
MEQSPFLEMNSSSASEAIVRHFGIRGRVDKSMSRVTVPNQTSAVCNKEFQEELLKRTSLLHRALVLQTHCYCCLYSI